MVKMTMHSPYFAEGDNNMYFSCGHEAGFRISIDSQLQCRLGS